AWGCLPPGVVFRLGLSSACGFLRHAAFCGVRLVLCLREREWRATLGPLIVRQIGQRKYGWSVAWLTCQTHTGPDLA
ncbi:MAG: hypothetical protein ACRDPY_14490, partial [Streptosporangiaceae bacterium]